METKVNDVKQYWKKRSISAKIDLTVQRNDYRAMEVSKMAEKFTLNSTLNEILENERMEKKLSYIFNPIYYQTIRPMFRKMKLKNMVKFAKTPWGNVFPAEGFLRCANFILERRKAGERISIPIWQGIDDEKLEKVVLVPFTKPDRKNAPCVIVCPGGAYNRVAFHNEGIPVAQKLCSMGYQTFVLSYRVYPDLYPNPQKDLIRAIRFVRKNHEKLGIDPANVTIMGFSAGGHLCGTVGALYDRFEDETHRYDDISARPDKICLCYPLISLMTDCHEDCNKNFLGEAPGDEDRRALSVEMILSKDYPKTYIWACEDDPVVPVSHTKMMEAALKNKTADYKAHIFPSGGHGIGIAEGTSAEGWIEEAMTFLQEENS